MADSTARRAARAVAGPAVRRVRRELQWRRLGRRLALGRAPEAGFGHQVATHATPLFRRLSGVQDRLQQNKVVNLSVAVKRLDGLVLYPGQRLSFWYQVGRPSRSRGFVDGLVLSHGQLTEGIGGGLCQLTNLPYWMSLHTPLTIAERWRHSYDVFADSGRTQPFGSGATCAWPVLDLQVHNGTTTAFRLRLQVGDTDLMGAWRSEQPIPTRY